MPLGNQQLERLWRSEWSMGQYLLLGRGPKIHSYNGSAHAWLALHNFRLKVSGELGIRDHGFLNQRKK